MSLENEEEISIEILSKEIKSLKNKITTLEKENRDIKTQLKDLNNLQLHRETQPRKIKIQPTVKEQPDGLYSKSAEKFEIDSVKTHSPKEPYRYRTTCPKCHAVGKNIRTVDDKEMILGHYGNIPMYAKKYECKKCGYEWK